MQRVCGAGAGWDQGERSRGGDGGKEGVGYVVVIWDRGGVARYLVVIWEGRGGWGRGHGGWASK